jgi:hypothetical protein
VGAYDCQIIVASAGLFQNVVYHQPVAYVRADVKDRSLQNLHTMFQMLALWPDVDDQLPGIGSQLFVMHARAGTCLRHTVQDCGLFFRAKGDCQTSREAVDGRGRGGQTAAYFRDRDLAMLDHTFLGAVLFHGLTPPFDRGESRVYHIVIFGSTATRLPITISEGIAEIRHESTLPVCYAEPIRPRDPGGWAEMVRSTQTFAIGAGKEE